LCHFCRICGKPLGSGHFRTKGIPSSAHGGASEPGFDPLRRGRGRWRQIAEGHEQLKVRQRDAISPIDHAPYVFDGIAFGPDAMLGVVNLAQYNIKWKKRL
jgi:hypothetical protein